MCALAAPEKSECTITVRFLFCERLAVNDDRVFEVLLIGRARNRGIVVAVVALCLIGLVLCAIAVGLSRFIDPDIAWALVSIPSFFAFLVVQPISEMVAARHLRTICTARGHLFDEKHLESGGEDRSICRRCDFRK